MSANDNSHLKLYQFYHGLIPGKQEFLDLQEPTRDALRRVNQRFFSDTAKTSRVPVITIPGAAAPNNFILRVADNAGIQEDGYTVDWEADQDYDCKDSTHGTVVGPTIPGATLKRYIVIAAKHEYVEADPRFDKLGNPVFYQDTSTTTLRVYQTVDFAMGDDYTTNATLAALLVSIRSTDFAVPLAIAERKDGTTEFVASDVHIISLPILPAATISTTPLLNQVVGSGLQAYVVSATSNFGFIAGTPNIVVGQPGTVSIAGGETVVLSVPKLGGLGEFRGIDKVEFTLPASTATLLAANTQHIIRARWDEGTLGLVVYVGYGSITVSFADNTRNQDITANWHSFKSWSSGNSNLGIPKTCIDFPIFEVWTGALGTLPTVKPIANHGLSEWAEQFIYGSPLTRGYKFSNFLTNSSGTDRVMSAVNINPTDADLQGVEFALGVAGEADDRVVGSLVGRQRGAGTKDGEISLTTSKAGVRLDRFLINEDGETFILSNGVSLPAAYSPGSHFSNEIFDNREGQTGTNITNTNNTNTAGERLVGMSVFGVKTDNTIIQQGFTAWAHNGSGNDNDTIYSLNVANASTTVQAMSTVGSEQELVAYQGNGGWIGANTPIAMGGYTEAATVYTLYTDSYGVDVSSLPGSAITRSFAGVLVVHFDFTVANATNPVTITCGNGAAYIAKYNWSSLTDLDVFLFDHAGVSADGSFSFVVYGSRA